MQHPKARPGPATDERNRCAGCNYPFSDLDFARTIVCPECGRPASVRVVLGERGYEEFVIATGFITGTVWFLVFCLSVPFGVTDPWWWLIAVPMSLLVLAATLRGIHVLGSKRVRGRLLAVVMALAPLIAIGVVVAGLLLTPW